MKIERGGTAALWVGLALLLWAFGEPITFIWRKLKGP
jgi:hypothetical protein